MSGMRISVSGKPRQTGHHETSKPSTIVHCDQFLDDLGTLSLLGCICEMPLINLIKYFAYQKKIFMSPDHLRLFFWRAHLSPLSPLRCLFLGRIYIPLVLMNTLPEFEDPPLMPPVTTIDDSPTFYLAGEGSKVGWGGATFTSWGTKLSHSFSARMTANGVARGGLGLV